MANVDVVRGIWSDLIGFDMIIVQFLTNQLIEKSADAIHVTKLLQFKGGY